MIDSLQNRLSTSSVSIFNFLARFVSGAVIGLTLALIAEVIFGFGTFLFVLVITVCTMLFLRTTRGWSILSVAILDLVIVLLSLLARMYILIAPGA